MHLRFDSGDTSVSLTPTLAIVRDILANAKQAMHVNDIAAEAFRTNRNLQLSQEEFAKKISAALSANVKTRTPTFSKVKNKTGGFRKGIYRLKSVRTKEAPPPPLPPTDPAYLGKGGEHAVMAELLFRGFNASLMAVDQGIDVVASKDNEYFHIQVKTSSLGANGKYAFSIKKRSFDANDGAKTFYIFVMRAPTGAITYVVLPALQIKLDHDNGTIASRSQGISIFITPHEKNTFTLNKGRDLAPFINRFDLIK